MSEQTIHISENAAKQLATMLAKDTQKQALRIVVDAGGCYGFQYNFKLDSMRAPDDLVFEEHGLQIWIDPVSYDFIKGSTVEFVEELIGSSFVINNPKASASCGCGSSFSI